LFLNPLSPEFPVNGAMQAQAMHAKNAGAQVASAEDIITESMATCNLIIGSYTTGLDPPAPRFEGFVNGCQCEPSRSAGQGRISDPVLILDSTGITTLPVTWHISRKFQPFRSITTGSTLLTPKSTLDQCNCPRVSPCTHAPLIQI
jgi:hypothetical protein